MPRSFLSANTAGVHPEVMLALMKAKPDHAPAYGHNDWTEDARRLFARHFCENTETLCVLTGARCRCHRPQLRDILLRCGDLRRLCSSAP